MISRFGRTGHAEGKRWTDNQINGDVPKTGWNNSGIQADSPPYDDLHWLPSHTTALKK